MGKNKKPKTKRKKSTKNKNRKSSNQFVEVKDQLDVEIVSPGIVNTAFANSNTFLPSSSSSLAPFFTLSCVDRCGQMNSNGQEVCFCDAACIRSGDCCVDAINVCGGRTNRGY